MSIEIWSVHERFSLGYFGGERHRVHLLLDEEFGVGCWRVAWRLANGEILDYSREFNENFVEGYANHFRGHPDEAKFLTETYAFAYDKNPISRDEAFDPNAYYNRPGFVNQIHHAALNIALEQNLGIPFRGKEPIQVREGKPETPQETWPVGWRWSPGRIMTPNPQLIPDVPIARRWHWKEGSIEHMYQAAKVIEVREI